MFFFKIVFAFFSFLAVQSAATSMDVASNDKDKDNDGKGVSKSTKPTYYLQYETIDNCPNGGVGDCYLGPEEGFPSVKEAQAYCSKNSKCQYM